MSPTPGLELLYPRIEESPNVSLSDLGPALRERAEVLHKVIPAGHRLVLVSPKDLLPNTHRIALNAMMPLMARSRGRRFRARIPSSSSERPVKAHIKVKVLSEPFRMLTRIWVFRWLVRLFLLQ